MPTETVLVQVVTAANLAGIEQAKGSLLGLQASTLVMAAAFTALVVVGKAAVENAKAQDDAYGQLKQATDAYNESLGKTIPLTDEQKQAVVEATTAQRDAHDALTIATHAVTRSQLAYTKAVKDHGAHSDEATRAALSLQDAQIRLAAAQRKSTEASNGLKAAQSQTATVTTGYQIDLERLKETMAEFLEVNKAIIPNQYDAVKAMAELIRSGKGQTEAFRILNDALDMAALKNEDVSKSTERLILVLAGNGKALRELGITTEQYTAIMGSTMTAEQKHAALLDLIESKTAKGRDTVSQLAQSQNSLNKAWQDFTVKIGPPLLTIWSKLNEAAATGVGILAVYVDLLEKIWKLEGQLGSSGPVRSQMPVGPTRGPRPTQMAAFDGSGSGGGLAGNQFHIHVDRGAFIDGPSIDILVSRLIDRMRTTGAL